jgi:hypothetical protein
VCVRVRVWARVCGVCVWGVCVVCVWVGVLACGGGCGRRERPPQPPHTLHTSAPPNYTTVHKHIKHTAAAHTLAVLSPFTLIARGSHTLPSLLKSTASSAGPALALRSGVCVCVCVCGATYVAAWAHCFVCVWGGGGSCGMARVCACVRCCARVRSRPATHPRAYPRACAHPPEREPHRRQAVHAVRRLEQR